MNVSHMQPEPQLEKPVCFQHDMTKNTSCVTSRRTGSLFINWSGLDMFTTVTIMNSRYSYFLNRSFLDLLLALVKTMFYSLVS